MKGLVFGSYPITPASDILHELSKHADLGVTTFQAEDEIAAICAAIGAAFAGAIGVSATSGPGLALKTEALGLAVATELPLVVIDVQRAGPSTGMPTKTEQADLWAACFARSGEAPLCVLAPRSPADCFDKVLEAVGLAIRHMIPVIVLSDAYLANGTEPWQIPSLSSLPSLEPPQCFQQGERLLPYARDDLTLARPWIPPGTRGGEHRIGGLEREDLTGNLSSDPSNHQRMSELRARKLEKIAEGLPPARIELGSETGELLVVGWGSTHGAIHEAVAKLLEAGHLVSHLHLGHLRPLPPNLAEIAGHFRRILVCELNLGQLAHLLRAELLRKISSYSKLEGRPFRIGELVRAMLNQLEEPE